MALPAQVPCTEEQLHHLVRYHTMRLTPCTAMTTESGLSVWGCGAVADMGVSRPAVESEGMCKSS